MSLCSYVFKFFYSFPFLVFFVKPLYTSWLIYPCVLYG